MLTAEVVASLSGKNLDFADWDGDTAAKAWARDMRKLIEERDIDADLNIIPQKPVDTPESPDEPLPADLAEKSRRAVSVVQPEQGYDSDDSLAGYASPPSSRSVSPTPSELDDIEKDPTLGLGAKKIPVPVYLAQVGEMLRGPVGAEQNDAAQEADKIEMALNYAEELIRKKREYGTELGMSCFPCAHT